MVTKNHIRSLISLLITVVVFIVLFKKVSFDQVFLSVRGVNVRIAFPVIVVCLFNGYFVSALRWKFILGSIGCNLSLKDACFIKVSSSPIIGAVPLKIGEISRVMYLKKINGIDPENAVSSIFAEYCLNIVTLVFIVFVGLLLGLISGSCSISLSRQSFFLCSAQLSEYFSKNKKIAAFKQGVSKCFNNRDIFKNKSVLIASFCFGVLEVSGFYFLAKSLGIKIPFHSVLLSLPIIIIGSSLPLTFLGLGIREGMVVLLFQEYGPVQDLLALGMLYSFAEHLLPMFIGLGLTSVFVNKIFRK